MSGDVQPRKRKDKKRKKDDNMEQTPLQPSNLPSTTLNDDVNIHVHKEEGTGGGICAKIVFFLLFSALAVLIGLIITEHRGLTDLEATDQDSRFSRLFEGWIDSSTSHDDHDNHIIDSLEDDAASHEEEADSHQEEPESHEQEETEEVNSQEEDPGSELSQEEAAEPDEEEDQTGEVDQSSELADDEDDLEKIPEDSEEEVNASESVADDDQEETVESEEQVPDQDESSEIQDESPENQDEEAAPEDDETESQEADQDASPEDEQELQNESEEEDKDVLNEDEQELENASGEETETPPPVTNLIIKIGVGIALLVVAHVVLVKKWKSESSVPNVAPEEQLPDLSRRNTIILPPSYQNIAPELDPEEYSEEEESIEEESHLTELHEQVESYKSSFVADENDDEYGEEIEEEEELEEEMEEEEEELEAETETDDDEDLLERLEAKYGKLKPAQFSLPKHRDDSESEPDEYENITAQDDLIQDELETAHESIKNNAAYAIKLFDVLLRTYPSSPRSLYGKAQALDALSEQKRSNEILLEAIGVYSKLLSLKRVPDALYEAAADRCIKRMRFLGKYADTIQLHKKLIERFPHKPQYQNDLAITYLTINRINTARDVLQSLLKTHPNNGVALVHYGFILKTTDNKLQESVTYLRRGLATQDPGVVDGRFYFHLGDALARLGRVDEAMKVYEEGVVLNLFKSKYQRSLYNVDRLKAQPWWPLQETPYKTFLATLVQNWEQIRDEGLSALGKDGTFQNEAENLKDTGDWKQFELFAKGQMNYHNCKKCPFTCKIIERIPDAAGCRRGQTKFSVIHPGTHVWPHCGPTNCRLRAHLGLKVPDHTYLRVGEETRTWKDGELFIFDDSFEHEVWHNGSSLRLVLIVDFWHPELTKQEKQMLSSI